MMRLTAGVIFLALSWSGTLLAESGAGHIKTATAIAVPDPGKLQTATAQASASQVVAGLYDHLLLAMRQGETMDFQKRYDALQASIERSFDLPLMTRFAAGSGWLKADALQQQRLINAFSDFSIATYASRFKSYDGEEFVVVNEKPAEGGGIIVETKLIPKADAPVTLNYLLRQDKQGAWRINDVYLDATISEMATRRAEFSAVITADGVDRLIENIQQKVQTLRQL